MPGQRHVQMRIVAESDTPAAGSRVALALVSVPDAGWHGYWKNPGAVGTQPRLEQRLLQRRGCRAEQQVVEHALGEGEGEGEGQLGLGLGFPNPNPNPKSKSKPKPKPNPNP